MIAGDGGAREADLGLSDFGLAHDQDPTPAGLLERRISGAGRAAGRLPGTERLLECGEDALRIHVAHHREQRVVARDAVAMEADHLVARDALDRPLPSDARMAEWVRAH